MTDNIARFTTLKCIESNAYSLAGEPKLLYAVDGGPEKVLFEGKIWENSSATINKSVGFNEKISLRMVETDFWSPDDNIGTYLISARNLDRELHTFKGKGDRGYPEIFTLFWEVEKILIVN